eukprot:CAMPEP_0178438196 /NCGR_PEP_ID=MMETSP0689_2-20121128/35450_1 /TAXON_ID=160604 /ORGANISM="Amphidinium massartii, Strain CS-259" /LENGTH=33 /DNA_ID= /DNA_START= /DNA_END= /DNA_ORIENTATION=
MGRPAYGKLNLQLASASAKKLDREEARSAMMHS